MRKRKKMCVKIVKNKVYVGRVLGIVIGITIFAILLLAGSACAAPVEEWNKTFGGTYCDIAKSVQQTSDGGYIIGGYTSSYGAHDYDAWLIKTDENGNPLWGRTFGGAGDDYATSVQQTSDGGYILGGSQLIKTDSDGNSEWIRTLGSNNVQQTMDGGYILVDSYKQPTGWFDVLLIKTDENGNKSWERTFGEAGNDVGNSVYQTSDGGYIVAGNTACQYCAEDALLIKTDANGNEQWSRTFGGAGGDRASSVQQTSDGGYIFAGVTGSEPPYGAWLIKIDAIGCDQWSKIFGEASWASSVQQTSDGGYILAGWTTSNGFGSTDLWLTKTDANGNQLWNIALGGTGADKAYSVYQTSDGGYILAGYTESYGAGDRDAWLIKVKGEPTISIFDTEQSENPYPSIMGTHKGEIKPSDNISVSKLYTYPCAGTGGHTESIELYENTTLIASGAWSGYQSDYHNITITPSVILQAGHTYNYTIVTGSYPQIIHAKSKDVTGGTITCTSFVDANGKTYTDWIPAIRLE